MKIGMYAYDVGPNNMLNVIADVARERGHEVVHAPTGQPVGTRDYTDLLGCELIILGGLASFETQHEVDIAEQLLNIGEPPFVVVEDTPYSSLRPLARLTLAPAARAAYPASQGCVEDVQRFGYRDVRYVGPPAHWGQMYQNWMDTPNIRGELTKTVNGRLIPLVEDDRVLFFGGSKDPKLNNDVLESVIQHAHVVFGPHDYVLGFTPHPYEEVVDEEVARRRQLFSRTGLQLLNCEGHHTNQLQPLADIPIFTGGATDSFIAAYARSPMLYVTSEANRARLESIGVPQGAWYVAESGAATVLDMDGSAEDAQASLRTLANLNRHPTRIQQDAAFGVPMDWNTAARLLQDIGRLT